MTKILKIKKYRNYFYSTIIIVLVLAGITTSASLNTDDWLDTFESADSLKNWRNPYGNYTVDKNLGILVASHCYSINGFCLSSLWRNSTSATGTWSFDLSIPDNHSFFILYFIGISATTDGFHPNTGYALQIDKYKVIHLRYRQNGLNPIISSYTPSNETNDWMHFDIIRNSTGYMEIFLNHLSIITGQDNRFTISENINFQLDNGAKLDNVSYSQSIKDFSANSSGTSSPGFEMFVTIFTLSLVLIKRKNFHRKLK